MVLTIEPDVKPNGEFSVGSSQMLKLFKISKVFEGEAELLKIVYISEVHCGLSCSIQNETKGRNSGTKTLKGLISLGEVVAKGSKWIHLPDYRSGDLIYTRKALKSLEAMSRQFQVARDDSPLAERLKT